MVRDALTMGPRHGEDEITPHTRPPADEDGDHMLVRTVLCLEGSVEVELVCEPVFDYGRTPAEWSLVGDEPPRRRRDRRVTRRSGCRPTWRSASRATGARHGTRSSRASRSTARCPGPRGSPRRRTSTRPTPGSPPPRASGATGCDRARLPDHRWRDRDRALGAGDQGPHLHAHRRHGRRAHHVAARDAGWRAQLGLPLHLDPGLDLHAAGAALPRTWTGRPTSSCSSSPTSSRTRTGRFRSCTGSTAAAT